MDRELWKAINSLLDEAEFAVGLLKEHARYEHDPRDRQPEPNSEIISAKELKSAIDWVEKLMPPEPETDLEKAIARAEYEENR